MKKILSVIALVASFGANSVVFTWQGKAPDMVNQAHYDVGSGVYCAVYFNKNGNKDRSYEMASILSEIRRELSDLGVIDFSNDFGSGFRGAKHMNTKSDGDYCDGVYFDLVGVESGKK